MPYKIIIAAFGLAAAVLAEVENAKKSQKSTDN